MAKCRYQQLKWYCLPTDVKITFSSLLKSDGRLTISLCGKVFSRKLTSAMMRSRSKGNSGWERNAEELSEMSCWRKSCWLLLPLAVEGLLAVDVVEGAILWELEAEVDWWTKRDQLQVGIPCVAQALANRTLSMPTASTYNIIYLATLTGLLWKLISKLFN